MNTNRTNQEKYLAIYLNRELPSEGELLELNRIRAVKRCFLEFFKDIGVGLAFAAASALVMVIASGC